MFKLRYFLPLFIGSFFFHLSATQATIPQSCDCQIDTVGYANFVTTLTVADVPMQFHVHNTFAVAIGYINTNTPNVVQQLINNHPNVTTIVLLDSGGSDDDQANLQASQLLRNAGYKMYLPSNASIASGAVDMFFSGTVRVIDPGAMVGVHSWSDGVNDATVYPVGHANHQPYINYYMNMGLSQQEAEDFYYFTINAAPAASIYWMTDSQLDQYKLRTCKYAAQPVYTVTTNNMTLTADLANANYQWIDCSNNTAITGATNQSFQPTQTGTYAVIVTEGNCSDTSTCIPFSLTNIAAITSIDVAIYPNPVQSQLTIEMPTLVEKLTLKITDLTGKVVYQQAIHTSSKQQIDFDYPSGIYLLTLSNAQGSYTTKLVKL